MSRIPKTRSRSELYDSFSIGGCSWTKETRRSSEWSAVPQSHAHPLQRLSLGIPHEHAKRILLWQGDLNTCKRLTLRYLHHGLGQKVGRGLHLQADRTVGSDPAQRQNAPIHRFGFLSQVWILCIPRAFPTITFDVAPESELHHFMGHGAPIMPAHLPGDAAGGATTTRSSRPLFWAVRR